MCTEWYREKHGIYIVPEDGWLSAEGTKEREKMKIIEEKKTKEGLTVTLYDDGTIGLSNQFADMGIGPEDMEVFNEVQEKSKKIISRINNEAEGASKAKKSLEERTLTDQLVEELQLMGWRFESHRSLVCAGDIVVIEDAVMVSPNGIKLGMCNRILISRENLEDALKASRKENT